MITIDNKQYAWYMEMIEDESYVLDIKREHFDTEAKPKDYVVLTYECDPVTFAPNIKLLENSTIDINTISKIILMDKTRYHKILKAMEDR